MEVRDSERPFRLRSMRVAAPLMRRSVAATAALLLLLLQAQPADGGLSGIKVLWMNNDKDKKVSNIGASSGSKLDAAPVGDCGGLFDDTTDRLLQDAIRNIDQLTSVARKLSSEDLHSLLSTEENNIPIDSGRRPDGRGIGMGAPSTRGAGLQNSHGRCRVTFRAKNDMTQLGDSFLILGSNELGNWRPDKALKLTTTASTFPVWSGTVDIPSDGNLEYKFVIQSASGELKWEPGSNRHFQPADVWIWIVDSLQGDIAVSEGVGSQAQGHSGANIRAEYGQANARVAYTDGSSELVPAAVPQAIVQRAVGARPAPAAGTLALPSDGLTARVHFRIKCNTSPGEAVSVCGSVPGIGMWNPGQALQLRCNKDEYPYWSGETEVALNQVKDCIRYKYVVKSTETDAHRWEDAIADRTIVPERRAGQVGVLAANTETFVDDGPFNQLQRTCTFVREMNPRAGGRAAPAALATSGTLQVPAGMQLVSMEQVRQWEARVQELEEECTSLKERAKAAETAVDALSSELEEERRQNEEIQKQMQFVEALISRMKKMEEQVAVLEQTKEVLITRSESLTDVSARAAGAGASPASGAGDDGTLSAAAHGDTATAKAHPNAHGLVGGDGGGVAAAAMVAVAGSLAQSIDAGLAGAKQILSGLDQRIPR